MARKAPDTERLEGLHKLPGDYLACRDVRHTWVQYNAMISKRYRGAPREVKRILVCTRCSTERHDLFHVPSWQKLSYSYVYPDDYILPGNGYVRGEEVRRAVFGNLDQLPDAE